MSKPRSTIIYTVGGGPAFVDIDEGLAPVNHDAPLYHPPGGSQAMPPQPQIMQLQPQDIPAAVSREFGRGPMTGRRMKYADCALYFLVSMAIAGAITIIALFA